MKQLPSQPLRRSLWQLMPKLNDCESCLKLEIPLYLIISHYQTSKDLLPDLFNKLTLDLQRAILLVYTTVRTLKELIDYYLAINQGLHQIKAHVDWIKAKNPLNQATSNIKTALNTPVQPATPAANTILLPEPIRLYTNIPVEHDPINKTIPIRL